VAKSGHQPFPIEVMVRIHFLQFWNNYSDPAMEEALYDMPVYRWFVGLDFSFATLRGGTAIDATLIAPPSSTKNKGGACDLEVHQTKKKEI
jgi:IS5 family transposase